MRRTKGPASAGPFRASRALVIAACLVAMSACTNPFASDLPETSAEPLPGLSERPKGEATLTPDAEALAPGSTTTTASPSAGPNEVTTTAAPNGPATTTTTTTSTARAGGSTARASLPPTRVDDPANDAGLNPPAYADARLLYVEDLGDAARVTVRLAAALPATLAEKEVMGIGVDFHRTGGTESDYQLFADGGSDGWRAYLQTPEGFVQYRGEFRMSGDSVQFEVPWEALGGDPTGAVKAFVDWGKPNVGGLIVRSADAIPDRGTTPLGG